MANERKYAKIIAEIVRSKMDKDGLNQTGLANRLGWSRQSMSDFLSGNRLPRVSTLIEVAGAIGLSPAELLMTPEERAVWEKAKTQVTPNFQEAHDRETAHALIENLDHAKVRALLLAFPGDLEALTRKKSG